MKGTEKLAELIYSLSKSEKRYFKLYAQRHTIGESNKYVELFDAIDKVMPYNKEYIFQKFKGDPMLNNFNVTKKRLYDHILSALEQYHSDSTINTQLNSLLNSIEILYRKGLYNQSLKLVRSSKKTALDSDRTSYLLIFSQWEIKLLKTKGAFKTIEELNKASDEEANVVQNIQDQIELESIKSKLISIQHNSNALVKQAEINPVVKKVFQKDEKTLPIQLRFELKSIQALGSYLKGDFDKAINVLKDKLNLYLNHKKRITRNPSDFMSDLANLIHLESSHGKLNDAREHLSILNSFPQKYKIKKTENFEIKFFATHESLLLSYYMHQHDFNKIISQESIIKEKLEGYSNKFPETRKSYFYYMLGVAHFYQGSYKSALFYSNLISNSNKDLSDSTITIYNKWLEIFIHFELENLELVRYKVASAKKYLKKHATYNEADNEVFSTLSKINEKMNHIEVSELLEKHYTKLKSMDSKPHMTFSRTYFDYLSWIASKISGGNLKDQLKRA